MVKERSKLDANLSVRKRSVRVQSLHQDPTRKKKKKKKRRINKANSSMLFVLGENGKLRRGKSIINLAL